MNQHEHGNMDGQLCRIPWEICCCSCYLLVAVQATSLLLKPGSEGSAQPGAWFTQGRGLQYHGLALQQRRTLHALRLDARYQACSDHRPCFFWLLQIQAHSFRVQPDVGSSGLSIDQVVRSMKGARRFSSKVQERLSS